MAKNNARKQIFIIDVFDQQKNRLILEHQLCQLPKVSKYAKDRQFNFVYYTNRTQLNYFICKNVNEETDEQPQEDFYKVLLQISETIPLSEKIRLSVRKYFLNQNVKIIGDKFPHHPLMQGVITENNEFTQKNTSLDQVSENGVHSIQMNS